VTEQKGRLYEIWIRLMKSGFACRKILICLLCTVLLLSYALPAFAAAETMALQQVYIEFNTAFEAANLIPYSCLLNKVYPTFAELKIDDIGMEEKYLPYIKNGVVWIDMTDPDYPRYLSHESNERFVKGHRYQVRVSLSISSRNLDYRCVFSDGAILRVNGIKGYWHSTGIRDDQGVYRYTAVCNF
ncbi:MAG: hypothetical protein IKI37_02145, partial [Oscillospiraceae bacterium]|nr:hypothetical protein [Oscillospiraceae bacterium]